jgi:hypothetical protein
MAATLKLFGFCGIGVFNGKRLAVLPKSSMPIDDMPGPSHHLSLSAKARDCDLAATKPEYVFFDDTGEQYLGWNLDHRRRVRFQGQSGNARWKVDALLHLMDLRKYHDGEAIQVPQSTPFLAVELTAGWLANDSTNQRFLVTHDRTQEDRPIGLAVTFESAGNILEIDGEALLQLKDGKVATIANVAPIGHGHHHFHLYYDELFVELPDKRVTLEVPLVDTPTIRGLEIFDCVPPAPLP